MYVCIYCPYMHRFVDAILRRSELLQAGRLTLADYPHSLFEGEAGALILLHRYYQLTRGQDSDSDQHRDLVEEGY